jgi:UDP-N-acetylglucosamine/UDP-N-acetylgalactosamine diphosphorylase
MAFTYDDAKALLEGQGQGHVLGFWPQLNEHERSSLLAQIRSLDMATVRSMGELLKARGPADCGMPMEPAPVVVPDAAIVRAGRGEGESALRAGKVGVLMVAGGQGSRLGYEGPKGVFPIGPVSGAPLFEVHCRKILALERRYRTEVPFYIMTSETNDADTRAFFAENDYFGLVPQRVTFFKQGMWPAMDADGRLILEKPGRLFMSPDGHGGILSALKQSGAIADMAERGIETLFYFQVDNPLVEVADPVFIGLHRRRNADVSVKVCAKRDPDEGLGVVVKRGEKFAVVEYTELSREQKHERTSDGNLKFRYGSVAIHVFSFRFLRKEADAGLPIHVAHKKVPYCAGDGRIVKPDAANAFKFERFIFDVLPDAQTVLNVAFRREDEFSPVKNASGSDSPETTRRDMIMKAARMLEAAGVSVPRGETGEPMWKIEIDPAYALDASDLRSKLQPGFAIVRDTLLK